MDHSQSSTNLEDRLRAIVHTNNATDASTPIHGFSSPHVGLPVGSKNSPRPLQVQNTRRYQEGEQPGNGTDRSPSQTQGPKPRRQGRPNQAQRKLMTVNAISDLVPPVSHPIQKGHPKNVPQYEANYGGDISVSQGYQNFKSDHVRDVYSQRQTLPERTPNMGLRQKGFSRQSPHALRPSSNVYGANGRGNGQPQAQYSRQPPRYTQLYNPSNNQDQRAQYHHQEQAAIHAQVGYLDEVWWTESPSFTVSNEELFEKAKLETRLREICCRAVVEHETKKNVAFDANTVHLKCFGSVGTGFAMPNSDMDLAILSPLSDPEPRATDSPIPRLLEKALMEAGHGARLLTKTRVPIIRFCEKPTDELRSALLEARVKWEAEEQERLLKPKVEPQTKSKKSKLNAEEHDDSKSEPSLITGSIKASVDTRSDEPRSKGVETSTTVSDGLEASDRLEERRVDRDKEPKAEQREPTPFVIETEGEDEDAPARSDEDRVRLYKLAMQDGWYLPPERRIIHDFIRKVSQDISSTDPDGLHQARNALKTLPNILKRHREHGVNPLDFPKSGVGIQCDINFSNLLALHNTKLLYCYSLCDARVKLMVLFVKRWAKRRKINSPYHGTLSSYGYVLMVLHYLINVAKPPVLPNLQHVPAAMIDQQDNISELEGYNVRFWRDEAAITATVQHGQMNSNTESAGSLLRGFFQYFGTNNLPFTFDWMTQVLSLRTIGGILTKQSKGWMSAKTITTEAKNQGDEKKEVRHRYIFAIEDPFEIDHNVARTVVHNGIVAIRTEFRRAVAIIGSVGYDGSKSKEELMAEAEEREHLQFKPFGHPPRGYGRTKAPRVQDKGTEHGKTGEGDGTNIAPTPLTMDKGSSAAVVELQKQVSQLTVSTGPAKGEGDG